MPDPQPNSPPPQGPPPEELPPGADRFWGQFSRARSGRSRAEEEPSGSAERGHGSGHQCLDWCPICRSAELLRATASPELRAQLQALQEEAMGIVRAVASAYAEKAAEADARRKAEEAPPRPDAEEPDRSPVRDIRIE